MSGFINVNGSKKEISGCFINVNGNKKEVNSIYGNVNGSKKLLWSNNVLSFINIFCGKDANQNVLKWTRNGLDLSNCSISDSIFGEYKPFFNCIAYGNGKYLIGCNARGYGSSSYKYGFYYSSDGKNFTSVSPVIFDYNVKQIVFSEYDNYFYILLNTIYSGNVQGAHLLRTQDCINFESKSISGPNYAESIEVVNGKIYLVGRTGGGNNKVVGKMDSFSSNYYSELRTVAPSGYSTNDGSYFCKNFKVGSTNIMIKDAYAKPSNLTYSSRFLFYNDTDFDGTNFRNCKVGNDNIVFTSSSFLTLEYNNELVIAEINKSSQTVKYYKTQDGINYTLISHTGYSLINWSTNGTDIYCLRKIGNDYYLSKITNLQDMTFENVSQLNFIDDNYYSSYPNSGIIIV